MSATETQAEKNVGTTRLRKEDSRLVTGRTNWTDDIRLTGTLHMAVVRSPMAHARITSVDLSGATDMPGVVAAYSGADLADTHNPLPSAWPVVPDMVNPPHMALATDEVAYVGDGVAVVLARTKAEAVDFARGLGHAQAPAEVVILKADGTEQQRVSYDE